MKHKVTSEHSPIKIIISRLILPNGINSSFQDELKLERELSSKFRDFATSLGFPDSLLLLDITFQNGKETQFYINGFLLPVNVYLDNRRQDSSLVSSLFKAFIHHRDLIITPLIADQISKSILGKSDLPSDLVTNFLKQLSYHGIGFAVPLSLLQSAFKVRSDVAWLKNQVEIIVAACAPKGLSYVLHNSKMFTNEEEKFQNLKTAIFVRFGFPLDEEERFPEVENHKANGLLNNMEFATIEELTNDVYDALGVYFNLSIMDRILSNLREAFPMVVFNSLEVFGSERLVKILRTLLEEYVSIRDLRGILGSLLEINGRSSEGSDSFKKIVVPYGVNLIEVADSREEPSIHEFVSYVRIKLANQIVDPYLKSPNSLKAIEVSDDLENGLMGELTNENRVRLIFELYKKFRDLGELQKPKTVVLTRRQNRLKLRKIIQRDLPQIPIFCIEEIPKKVKIAVTEKFSFKSFTNPLLSRDSI